MIIRPILLVLIVATTASTIGRATIAPPLVCSAMIVLVSHPVSRKSRPSISVRSIS